MNRFWDTRSVQMAVLQFRRSLRGTHDSDGVFVSIFAFRILPKSNPHLIGIHECCSEPERAGFSTGVTIRCMHSPSRAASCKCKHSSDYFLRSGIICRSINCKTRGKCRVSPPSFALQCAQGSMSHLGRLCRALIFTK